MLSPPTSLHVSYSPRMIRFIWPYLLVTHGPIVRIASLLHEMLTLVETNVISLGLTFSFTLTTKIRTGILLISRSAHFTIIEYSNHLKLT